MALKHLITQGFVFCDGEIGWLITGGFGTLAADELAEASVATKGSRVGVGVSVGITQG